MRIESTQNPRIKSLVRLQQKSKERKQSGEFLVEGIQEIQFALASNYVLKQLFVCEEVFKNELPLNEIAAISISKSVYQKLAYRSTTGGVIGVFKAKAHALADFKPKENGIYLVLEGIEKPGNIGAIVRSADGAGVDGVFISGVGVDLYNPNAIRSSVGTIFSTRVYLGSNELILSTLRQNGIPLYATYLGDKTQDLYATEWGSSVAFVLGTESTGIQDFWLDSGVKTIKIPMLGRVDSLNVSTAAALCIYEARRRLNKKATPNNTSE